MSGMRRVPPDGGGCQRLRESIRREAAARLAGCFGLDERRHGFIHNYLVDPTFLRATEATARMIAFFSAVLWSTSRVG